MRSGGTDVGAAGRLTARGEVDKMDIARPAAMSLVQSLKY